MDRQTEQQPKSKNPFVVKVYLVFIPNNTPAKGVPNRKVIAAKLTWSAAKHIQDQIPGSEIERVFADKEIVEVNGDISKLEQSLKGENQNGTQSTQR